MNALLARLGIRLPIVQAPMAGGATTPDLVAAVSNAGGLGSLGLAYTTPQDAAAQVAAVRERTRAPFAANLFAPEAGPRPEGVDPGLLALLRELYAEVGLEPPALPERAAPDFDAQAEALVAARVPVVSFTFGLLPAPLVARLRAAGSTVVGTATTVEEARALEASGVDAVVAQGSEAGGHRGSFLAKLPDSLVGTMALVPQVADAVRVPVIASGGIMDGRGVLAALALGAQAVQMGTAFLACAESGVPEAYKKALAGAREDGTTVTRAFSGRWARALRNRLATSLEERGLSPAPFPWHNALTAPLRRAAAARERTELMSLYAGQGLRMVRRLPAAELVARLEAEMNEAAARLPLGAAREAGR